MGKEYHIGDFLKRIKRPVNLINSDSYKLVTIKLNHKGVVLREFKKGNEIKSSMYLIKNGDFILSGIDARNGAFGIVPPELDYAIITNDFWCFEIDEDIISKKLFLEMTATSWFDDICKRGSEGTTQRIRLQKDKFFNQKVILPDRDEQEAMLDLLLQFKSKKADLLFEIERQEILIKQLRQSILEDAVKGKLVSQNLKDEPASDLLKRIQVEKEKLIKQGKIKKGKPLPPITENEIPYELPKGWIWCRLGEIASKIGSGSTPLGGKYSKNGFPFFRSQNVTNDGLDYGDIKYISNDVQKQMKGTVVYADDILLNITGGSMGRCALVPSTFEKGNVSQHVCIIRPIHLNNSFLHLLIVSPIFQKMIFASTTGAGREGLPKYNLEKFVCPIPPLSEQGRIVKKVNESMELCKALEREIAHSKQEADYLLSAILRETFTLKDEAKVIPLYTPQSLEAQYFAKRKVLATYIINQSLNDKQFGDTKFEKILHLSDYCAIKRNLGQAYVQKAAGPYDNAFTILYFKQIESSQWFNRTRKGNQFVFQAGKNHGKSINTYNYFSEEELKRVSRIINYFKNCDYEQPEIVSTLYAVWNNRVIRHQEISDDLLVADFYGWDEQKKKYERKRLESALQWMRNQNFVPDGWGKVIDKSKKSRKKSIQN